MRKKRFIILLAGLLPVICVFLSGCGLISKFWRHLKSSMNEAETYNESVDHFFAALDSRDKAAVRNLFSPYVRKTDEDLDEQIDLLLETHSGPTASSNHDGSRLLLCIML